MTTFMKAQKILLLPIFGQTRIFQENLPFSFIPISRLLSLSKILEKTLKNRFQGKLVIYIEMDGWTMHKHDFIGTPLLGSSIMDE